MRARSVRPRPPRATRKTARAPRRGDWRNIRHRALTRALVARVGASRTHRRCIKHSRASELRARVSPSAAVSRGPPGRGCAPPARLRRERARCHLRTRPLHCSPSCAPARHALRAAVLPHAARTRGGEKGRGGRRQGPVGNRRTNPGAGRTRSSRRGRARCRPRRCARAARGARARSRFFRASPRRRSGGGDGRKNIPPGVARREREGVGMRAPEAGRGGHLAGAEEGAQGDGAADGRPDGVHLRARRGTGGGGRSEETARVSQTDRAGGQGNFRLHRAREGAPAKASPSRTRGGGAVAHLGADPDFLPSLGGRHRRRCEASETCCSGARRGGTNRKKEGAIGRQDVLLRRSGSSSSWAPHECHSRLRACVFRLLARRVSLVSLACSSSGLAFRCDPPPPPRPSSPS